MRRQKPPVGIPSSREMLPRNLRQHRHQTIHASLTRSRRLRSNRHETRAQSSILEQPGAAWKIAARTQPKCEPVQTA